MASPFSVFRKNQTYWMAALVVIAIISFIVAPALEQVISGSSAALRANRSRLVSWNGGTIDEQHARRLQQIHGLSQTFLRRLVSEVLMRGGIPRVPGFEMQNQQSFTLGLNEYNDQLSVIQTKLFAERAKLAGITVSRETVDFYIRQLTDRKIDDETYKKLFRETTQGNLSHFELVVYLQDELAARLYRDMLEGGLSLQQRLLTTPGQSWQYFQKFNRRAKIEAYPVLVSEFVEEAKTKYKPTEQELRTLYESGKDRVPLSTSPLPGFSRRHSANIEFVSTNLDDHLKAAVAALSEEEILREYEKRVAAGRYRVPVTSEAPTGSPVESPQTGEAPSPLSSDSLSAGSDDSTGESFPADQNTTGDDSEKAPSEGSTSEAGDSSGDGSKAESTEDGDGQAFRMNSLKLRFVSTQDLAADSQDLGAAPTAPQAPAAPQDNSADSQPPVAEQSSASENVDTVLELGQPPEQDSLTEILSVDSPIPAGTTPPAGTSLDIGSAPPSGPATEMRVQTLEEVREELTRDMVFDSTRQKLQASLAAIVEKMQNYSDENQIYRRSIEAKDLSATKPELIDLQALADEHGLQFARTGMVDSESVMALPIGRSRIQNVATFPQVVFSSSLPLYSPGNSQLFDISGSWTFVFWKIEERPQYSPSFEEVRSEVEAVWYQQKAREFAREKAESIQKLVQSVEDSPWTAALSDAERALVATPNPFSWMTSSQFSRGVPSITFVDRLDTVGDDFMRRVFESSDGSVLVAPNEPQTIFYVVRVVETLPKTEDLLRLFALLPNQMDWQMLAFMESQRIRMNWWEKTEKDLDLAWDRQPSEIQQD